MQGGFGFWVSPYVLRVEWALKLKSLDYVYTEQDIFNKSSLLLQLNPVHKKVPVLVHDQKVIAESLVILEYIDETWKHKYPLLPQDPYERAQARFWAKFAEQKILEAAWNALCSLGDEKERAIQLTIEALQQIEGELKGKQFFGGERIGYLDIAAGWISYWLPVWEEVGSMKIVDTQQFPAISSWMHRFINHPVIKDNLPPRDKMTVYFNSRREVLTSQPHGWIRI